MLGPGDRMTRHKARQRRGQMRARRGDDVLLGAARVGDDGRGPQVRARSSRTARASAQRASRAAPDRRREFAVQDCVERIGAVGDAQPLRRVEIGCAPPDADHAARPRPRALSASANEPPIRPTPTTTSLASDGAGTPSASRAQPRSAARKRCVFRRQPDRNAQVFRQAIVRDRSHDHALPQQRVVDRCAASPTCTSRKLACDGT